MTLDIITLENWLWETACSIRGPLDAPKYKDYILPLLFYKRLSDVYADELQPADDKQLYHACDNEAPDSGRVSGPGGTRKNAWYGFSCYTLSASP